MDGGKERRNEGKKGDRENIERVEMEKQGEKELSMIIIERAGSK